ncbi:MAG: ribonuclease HII [Gammaproteobacteria bacterium]|nr:ribonuclease HII [Gammaproteobacteria bacterium]
MEFEPVEYPEGLHVAGVDEVGRGPLAGPVVAAAVILDPNNPIAGLNDSKRLTERRREQLNIKIREKALAWSIARAEVEEIDDINILQASLLAMQRAMNSLSVVAEYALIDGNKAPELNCPLQTVVKGDARVNCISAASIIAKVERDHEMVAMDEKYPGYGFASHKGYPTKQHLQALQVLGVTVIHRRSFAPVRRCLEGY